MGATNCYTPPLLPGMDDAAWCITACDPCVSLRRRYAECDYIDITPAAKKTFIRMLVSQQQPNQADPTRTRIRIEIKRRGSECVVACYTAFQRTADGFVGFYWDSEFTEACAGLYVGDVYIECDYCFSIRFRIPQCELVADACYNEYATESCGLGECSMLLTIGDGVVGGIECEVVPAADECGLPPPYFETMDPVVPIEVSQTCGLSCTPAFSIAGDNIIGDI